MQLHGLHHVTAVTGNAKDNLRFYTHVLGLRLVKKTVNQDDTKAYHLFYADKLGTPGTDMTFFDWPQTGKNQDTSDGITRTMFRVQNRQALDYWQTRFDTLQVPHRGIEKINGHDAICFTDPEGQKLALVDDHNTPFAGEVWDKSDVPSEYALRGFYAVEFTIPTFLLLDGILQEVLNFTKAGTYPDLDNPKNLVTVYTMDGGGPGKEVHVRERAGTQGWLGAGGVHHVAFRLNDDTEQRNWVEWIQSIHVPNSGIVDRFYFKSLYFRISEGILIELATDGPGFSADESPDHLGENLSLPPFLEPRRKTIEAELHPLS